MSARTPPDAAAIRAEAERLVAAFEAAGAQRLEPSILQDAATLLDLYGEDIRARAYVTHDPALGELMLRPDFTVPVVQMHMAQGAEPARYAYAGPVFRRQPAGSGRANEYWQVGFELFDRADPVAADAELFALFDRLLAGCGLRVVTGDIGILAAAVAGLATTARRKAALMRHIWRPRRFRALLERFGGRAPVPPTRSTLIAAARARGVAAVIAEAGAPQGLRETAEIAERIAWLIEDADAPPLPAAEVDRLEALLDVACPLPDAPAALSALAGDCAGTAAAIARLAARIDALATAGVAVEAIGFEAAYGRSSMEYYDGFVFGFHAAAADQPPVATGGRYDALTARLGGGTGVPAVGGVIRPDLLLAARGEGA